MNKSPRVTTPTEGAERRREERSIDGVVGEWAADRSAVDAVLEQVCDRVESELGDPVGKAVRYALTGGGKRLRALLVLFAYRACDGTGDAARLAAAVEVVHAYSLVHDDLPAMDDDELRRGRPTTHRVFGVPVATCAGLAMVPLAASLCWEALTALRVPRQTAGQIIGLLMRAAGAGGMIAGQLMDLDAEGRSLPLMDLERIHRSKTGALICASAMAGGLAAAATTAQTSALEQYGDALGLAFQISDDILDVTATSDTLGKTTGRDAHLRKSTYPALLGVEGAKARAHALVEDAIAAISRAGLQSNELMSLARFVEQRI